MQQTIIRLLAVLLVSRETLLALPASDIAKRAMPSVALLMMNDGRGQPLALGSAFVVADGVLLSNFHVVKGAAGGFAKLVGGNDKHDITGILASDTTHDLVLLQVGGLIAPSLPVDDASQVQLGDPVFVVGNPLGLEGTLSQGIVSGLRTIEEDRLLQITAPISSGSSGGPVLSSEGRVIGVAVATFSSGQNLNFAIPSSYVSLLLKTERRLSKFTEKTKDSGPSVIEKQAGAKDTTGVVVKHLRDNPGWHFTLQNRLDTPIKNIRYRMISYDKDGEVFNYADRTYGGTILPGMGIAVNDYGVDAFIGGSGEVRILYFDVVRE